MFFVAYTTAPFVSYVHLRLPIFARQSREHLMRWVKKIPPSTEVDLTTIRFYGKPRVSRMQISDLHPTKAKLGISNLVRELRDPAPAAKRPWWAGKIPRKFYVGSERGRSREPSIWQKVLEVIKSS